MKVSDVITHGSCDQNKPVHPELQHSGSAETTGCCFMLHWSGLRVDRKKRLPGTVENVLLFVLLRIQEDDNTPVEEG